MIETIKALEVKARQLETTPEKRQHWNEAIQAYADRFLNELPTAKGFYAATNTNYVGNMEVKENPRSIEELIEVVEKEVDHPGIQTASGAHLGYIPGGGVFPTAMGDYIAAVANKYAGMYQGGPGPVQLENSMIRWMCKLVGYPDTALGNLTSGGSIANLTAIVTARDALGITSDEVKKATIYLTPQVHHCVQKAFRIAGLAESPIRYIPMTDRFKMDVEFLEKQVKEDQAAGFIPFMVVGSAGTTDVGAIDPLNKISRIAKAANMWFHVDAAYGGFFLLTENITNPDGSNLKEAYAGIEQSDSLAIDPHKGLFLAYGLGALLIKNVSALMNTHHYKANYLQDAFGINPSDQPNPADLSPELTKHFRGMRMWLPLHLYGIDAFRATLEEKIMLTRYFYEEVQKLGFEVGPYPELSVMIYRYVPESDDANYFNERLLQYIHEDGRIFVSSTALNGKFWLRLAVLSFRSRLAHIQLYLEILKEGIKHLTKKGAVDSNAEI